MDGHSGFSDSLCSGQGRFLVRSLRLSDLATPLASARPVKLGISGGFTIKGCLAIGSSLALTCFAMEVNLLTVARDGGGPPLKNS